ncbi:hypothetical protein NMY22_g14829 [Coprinellus aureogranulatus]|nr:hypothetical protein NMY22_g14829 [Coprinellus aureogranulatus]
MYTDDDVLGTLAQNGPRRENGLFATVKCCILGAKCKQTHIVDVAVHPGYEARPRNIDLYVDQYLVPDTCKSSVGVRRLEGSAACIRHYPIHSRHEQRFHWTIFREPPFDDPTVKSPRNDLYDRFKLCVGSHRTVWGNIVIVKSSRDGGVVCHISFAVATQIQSAPSSFVEEGEMAFLHPVAKHPLVKERCTSGWGDCGWPASEWS